LPGEQGLQGEQGIQGEQGPAGEQGIQGIRGETGSTGNNGEDGADGVNGSGTFGPFIFSNSIFADNNSGYFNFNFSAGARFSRTDINGKNSAVMADMAQGVFLNGVSSGSTVYITNASGATTGWLAARMASSGVGVTNTTVQFQGSWGSSSSGQVPFTEGQQVIISVASIGGKGDTGSTGPAGANGINGTNGTNGIDGIDGADGAQGPQGEPGESGVASAVYPIIYDSETKTISFDEELLEKIGRNEAFSIMGVY
jgi:hypothetical protein